MLYAFAVNDYSWCDTALYVRLPEGTFGLLTLHLQQAEEEGNCSHSTFAMAHAHVLLGVEAFDAWG